MNYIENNFDKYFSFVFEDICRYYLNKKNNFLEIGSWWYKENEIDIVAKKETHVYFGEVKWKKSKMNISDLNLLIEKSKLVPINNSLQIKYVLFSKSGFDKKLIEYISDNNINVDIFSIHDLKEELY
jgi:uncharacterized protein